MASTACVSPSASLRLPLPHGCQDIFTDTRSACLSGFQGSIPLRAQTARGGSLKACPERSRTDPRDLGMDRLAEAFPYGCATPIRHPQSSVALRLEAATHMPRYFHTHVAPCLCRFRGKARFPPRSAMCGSGPDGHRESKAEFADGFDGMRLTIGKPSLAAATRMPRCLHIRVLSAVHRRHGQRLGACVNSDTGPRTDGQEGGNCEVSAHERDDLASVDSTGWKPDGRMRCRRCRSDRCRLRSDCRGRRLRCTSSRCC